MTRLLSRLLAIPGVVETLGLLSGAAAALAVYGAGLLIAPHTDRIFAASDATPPAPAQHARAEEASAGMKDSGR